MKTLLLVRHGKSSWEYGVEDKDRPLQERGINDGHLVSMAFKSQNPVIDAIFSSPANRALHTCVIFLRNLNHPFSKFQLTNELYDFSGGSVMRFVKRLDNSLNTVMVFGHNEAFTHVANEWGNRYIDNVPTTGLVQLDFDIDEWASAANAKTKQTIFPKALK